MLTHAQSRVFHFVAATVERDGRAPTLKEIAIALGRSSRAQFVPQLRALVERGYIARGRGHRDITILRPRRFAFFRFNTQTKTLEAIDADPSHCYPRSVRGPL